MNYYAAEIDQSVLDFEALKTRCLGNLALVERILSKFTGQLDVDLGQLQRAIETGDAVQAAELTHRIKGTAGSVAARNLYEDASRAEQRARDSQFTDLAADLERMRNDRSELIETIERMWPVVSDQ